MGELKAILTFAEVITWKPLLGYYLNWEKDKLKVWLRDKGFDLSKEITHYKDFRVNAFVFLQKKEEL